MPTLLSTINGGGKVGIQSNGTNLDNASKINFERNKFLNSINKNLCDFNARNIIHIDLIFNTTEGRKAIEDSFSLRRTALMRAIPYYTTVSGARAATWAIQALKAESLDVAPLQSYFIGEY